VVVERAECVGGGREGQQVVAARIHGHAEQTGGLQRGTLRTRDVKEGGGQAAVLVRDDGDCPAVGVGRSAAQEPAHAVDVLDDDRQIIRKPDRPLGHGVAEPARRLAAGVGDAG